MREQHQSAEWADIALMMTAAFPGIPFTADMVRNRYRRIREQIEVYEAAGTPAADEEFLEARPVPKGEYVGPLMGFYDIESTNLSALMGRMVSAAVADSWGNVAVRRITDFEQRSVIDDMGLAQWLRDELRQYDIIVGWNSKMFDISYLNARLVRHGVADLFIGDTMHLDLMYKAKAGPYGLRIGSAKLDNVAKFLRIPHAKTEIDWDVWALAGTGDADALEVVVEHNVADVLVTRDVYARLKPLVRNYQR